MIQGSAGGAEPRQPQNRRSAVKLVLALVLLALVLALVRGVQAARTALHAKRALLAVEADINSAQVEAAHDHLIAARAGFARARRQLGPLRPLLAVGRITPLVRAQVRGTEAFIDAGRLVAEAGLPIVKAATEVVRPADTRVTVQSALETLKAVNASLASGLHNLDAAMAEVRTLNGYRLVGPLGSARRDLLTQLPRINARARSAERGLASFIRFAGGSGARRYLVFSQNPDEVRPTGGFIGTYGVLAAASGKLTLERYDAIEAWTAAHPEAVVPPNEAGSPFAFLKPPKPQSLANVNNVADWPEASRRAMKLWQQGGEDPVDGVLSITPAFLARALTVIGPVSVDEYQELVSAENALEKIDFYTHVAPLQGRPASGGRKDFVAALAQTVVRRVLEAPADKWHPLARAVGESFDAREAMVWTGDAEIAAETSARRWDGALPATFGDFFYAGEFEAAAKNGRGLRRTYDHSVELRTDGSARITTEIVIANTEPAGYYNEGAFSYITVYGPQGATLDPASDPVEVPEAALSGHPANGWFRSAPPLGETTLKVVWNAPAVARRVREGRIEYGLWWMKLPDHTGDVLKLQVHPPPGWRWAGTPPPAIVPLERDFKGTWLLEQDG